MDWEIRIRQTSPSECTAVLNGVCLKGRGSTYIAATQDLVNLLTAHRAEPYRSGTIELPVRSDAQSATGKSYWLCFLVRDMGADRIEWYDHAKTHAWHAVPAAALHRVRWMTESTTVASTIPPPPPYSSLALRIADVLLAAGDMFSGGTIERAVEIAKEWQLAGFKPVAVANWTQIGFWDAQSARLLKDAGFSSHTHVLRFRDGREGDAVYAYCNGDVRLADLEWI